MIAQLLRDVELDWGERAPAGATGAFRPDGTFPVVSTLGDRWDLRLADALLIHLS